MTWRYEQASGNLSRDGIFLCRGYAGHGVGKNNPDMQTVHDVGPIPRGRWRMTAMLDTPEHGPRVIRLRAEEGTVTFGRDGFLIHGDSIAAPGEASHGCIIIGRIQREQVWRTQDTALEVVA